MEHTYYTVTWQVKEKGWNRVSGRFDSLGAAEDRFNKEKSDPQNEWVSLNEHRVVTETVSIKYHEGVTA